MLKLQRDLLSEATGLTGPKRATKQQSPLEAVDKELYNMEAKLPLCALSVFRSIAVEERIIEANAKTAISSSLAANSTGDPGKKMKNWFSWVGMAATQSKAGRAGVVMDLPDDDAGLEVIKKELEDRINKDVSSTSDIFLVR